MAERVGFIDHKGKQIIYLDFSDMQGDAMVQIVRNFEQIVMENKAKGNLVSLTNFTNARTFGEGLEEIKTAAGDFAAWKINGNIESKFGFMRVAFKTVEWYVENVGVVKSEYYDNKGKLMGSGELQSIN